MPVPHVVVFSSLFPHAGQPNAGLFIRERMGRVGRNLPVVVVSPQPWFPLQGLIRLFRPDYRPPAPRYEMQQGIEVYFPRFLAPPGLLRRLDGVSMALGSLPLLWRLRRKGRLNLIDAHFAYPNGYAAMLLGRWLGVPVTITLRGTEPGHVRCGALRNRVVAALQGAARIFSVSGSLRQLAVDLGVNEDKVRVVGNGVDLERFKPVARSEARHRLGLPVRAPILVSVGGLVERKGFHRVIECLPAMLEQYPELVYVVVGGPSPEGDMTGELKRQVGRLGLGEHVRFTGPMAPADLHLPLSAADVFVLATRNEGWANVFLEAMACGLPVVTTNVGGNAEVVCREGLGLLVPFGDTAALRQAIERALATAWDRQAIIAYARENTWDRRVAVLVEEFKALAGEL